jgi:hypothetical protein
VVDTENSFDVVLLADMTRGGDIGLRIRRELQALSGHGYRCGLRNLLPGSTGVIGPDIDRCIREGLALPLAPGQTVEARLAIGYSPGSLDAAVDISGVTAERIVLVIDTPPSPQQMGHWFAFGVGPVTWAPTNRWVRARLEELGFQVPVTEEDWRAIATPCRARAARAPLRFRPVAGRVGTSKASHWAKTAAEIDATYPTGGTFDIWMHGGPPAALEKDCDRGGRMEHFRARRHVGGTLHRGARRLRLLPGRDVGGPARSLDRRGHGVGKAGGPAALLQAAIRRRRPLRGPDRGAAGRGGPPR